MLGVAFGFGLVAHAADEVAGYVVGDPATVGIGEGEDGGMAVFLGHCGTWESEGIFDFVKGDGHCALVRSGCRRKMNVKGILQTSNRVRKEKEWLVFLRREGHR